MRSGAMTSRSGGVKVAPMGGGRGGITEAALQKLDRAKQELGAAKDSLGETAHELRKE